MVEVRAAKLADSGAIRSVHLAAFPTAAEADLVDALERDGDGMISLVATDGDEVIGHILFSRMHAEGDGNSLSALGLAPVAVLPTRQGERIGSNLIEAGLGQASAGADIVFVVGEPDYYSRFGFESATAAPFASHYAGPYFLAKALAPDFTLPVSGRADYAPAFASLS